MLASNFVSLRLFKNYNLSLQPFPPLFLSQEKQKSGSVQTTQDQHCSILTPTRNIFIGCVTTLRADALQCQVFAEFYRPAENRL